MLYMYIMCMRISECVCMRVCVFEMISLATAGKNIPGYVECVQSTQ